jgi:SAM-dependent methyltransferase
MKSAAEIKAIVRDKYGKIVKQELEQESSCRGPVGASSCCGGDSYTVFNDSYAGVDGHVAEADLGLGCGLPTQYAGLAAGQIVLDLGSGAGNDVFVARSIVGEQGRVIGLDMTPEMVDQARANNRRLGFANVEFILGEIEAIPLPDSSVDVVLSNCVLNLVPDKQRAYREIYRVLKPGGHFSISDIVVEGELSPAIQEAAELYAGCVAGALPRRDYLAAIAAAGFQEVSVPRQNEVELPESLLNSCLSPDQVKQFWEDNVGIYSITVVAKKV